MIQQQIYTRERRGLFRNSEGYDSVAKSPGLADAFIKENVHPFCVYNAPRFQPPPAVSEWARGNDAPVQEPAPEYPRAITVVRYPDGQALLGQAVYVAADFTGQRPTFFSHNYILPKEAADTLNFPAALNKTEFWVEYDIEKGKTLPELSRLPETDRPDAFAESDSAGEALERLGIEYKTFYKLVLCLLLSAAGPKKVYVVTPVPPNEVTHYARSLLGVLYEYLPGALMSVLGYCTYSHEPENKKGLHLTFLEKNALRVSDPRVARDYVLDFGQNLFKAEHQPEGSPFLEYVWERLTKGGDITSFYSFAAMFGGENADARKKVSIQYWDDMLALFRVFQDRTRTALPDAVSRKRIFSVIRQLLPDVLPEAEARYDFYGFTASLIKEEALAVADAGSGYVSSRGVMEEIAGFNLQDEKTGVLIVKTLYCYACKSPAEQFFAADLLRNTDAKLFGLYIDLLLEKNAARLLDGYFAERLSRLPLQSLFEEMRFWTAFPEIGCGAAFTEQVCGRVRSALAASQDAVSTANQLYHSLKTFHTEQEPNAAQYHKAFHQFVKAVLYAADEGLLSRLDISALTPETLAALPNSFIKRGMDKAEASFVAIDILKKISAALADAETGAINVRYFVGSYKLDADSYYFIIHKLREFFRARITAAHFDNITYLFRGLEKPGLDAGSLLTFIHDYAGDGKGAFIVWATENRVFNPQNQEHAEAVRVFIKQNIKDAAFKEVIYNNAALKALAREVRFGRLAGMLQG
ncbi:MAG: hypothetical protein LBR83_01570 [Clostridiales bacterium]|jgi:hypothetical protein|nr:hypothetical protein [Clostridiales bacterium]